MIFNFHVLGAFLFGTFWRSCASLWGTLAMGALWAEAGQRTKSKEEGLKNQQVILIQWRTGVQWGVRKTYLRNSNDFGMHCIWSSLRLDTSKCLGEKLCLQMLIREVDQGSVDREVMDVTGKDKIMQERQQEIRSQGWNSGKHLKFNNCNLLGMEAHVCSPRTLEGEAGEWMQSRLGLKSFRPSRAT